MKDKREEHLEHFKRNKKKTKKVTRDDVIYTLTNKSIQKIAETCDRILYEEKRKERKKARSPKNDRNKQKPTE